MAQRFNAGVPERKGAKSREGRKNVKGAGPPTHCPPLHWHIQPYCHAQRQGSRAGGVADIVKRALRKARRA
jgi:hypothetical protein